MFLFLYHRFTKFDACTIMKWTIPCSFLKPRMNRDVFIYDKTWHIFVGEWNSFKEEPRLLKGTSYHDSTKNIAGIYTHIVSNKIYYFLWETFIINIVYFNFFSSKLIKQRSVELLCRMLEWPPFKNKTFARKYALVNLLLIKCLPIFVYVYFLYYEPSKTVCTITFKIFCNISLQSN